MHKNTNPIRKYSFGNTLNALMEQCNLSNQECGKNAKASGGSTNGMKAHSRSIYKIILLNRCDESANDMNLKKR